MTFKEKIDNILKTNDLGINSVNGIEKYLKISTGSISKPYAKGKSPGRATVKKILDGFGIPDEDWEAGDFGQNDDVVNNNKDLIAALERLIQSKNEELQDKREELQGKKEEILRLQETQDKLLKMIDKLTGGGGSGEQTKK